MKCLTDAQIQAIVDGEDAPSLGEHAAACARCSSRIRERDRATTAIVNSFATDVDIPPHLGRRVEAALAGATTGGATRLRAGTGRSSRRRAFWSAGVAVAATIVAIFFVAPVIREPATVSASEILAASASRLAESAASGIEILEYELVLDGVPRELMPDQANGTYRVKQVIDHDTKGRFRFTSYAADGQLITSIAQDPANGKRVLLVRLEGQPYRFEFTLPAKAPLSLPEMERLHMQASISMMQASGDQHLQVLETPAGRMYRIEVPKVTSETTSAVWDLTEARVLIDADDYRIVELAVKGSFLKQPYSVSFRLLDRAIKTQGEVPAEEFDAPVEPGALTLQGEGTAVPARDALIVALRELARTNHAR
jgi:hypothetical protein